MVKFEELVASGGMSLQGVQLQLVKCLSDCIEAGGVERSDGGGSHCQLSLRCDDKVLVPKAHVHARDPTEVVTSHSRPSVDVETRKWPLPGTPIVGVSSCHQQVNF